MPSRQHNPELIRNALFSRCKLFWGAGLSVKLLVFVLGVIVVLAPINGKFVALGGLVLAGLSELLLWQSDRWKGAVHGLHRKLDFENSFGWYISESELMDYLARYPGNIDELIGKSTGSYFASNESPGAKRAIQNLRESAWWSTHLSESMFWRALTVIVAIIFACFFLLNVSVGNLAQPQAVAPTVATSVRNVPDAMSGVSSQTVKVATSAILFIFTCGL